MCCTYIFHKLLSWLFILGWAMLKGFTLPQQSNTCEGIRDLVAKYAESRFSHYFANNNKKDFQVIIGLQTVSDED